MKIVILTTIIIPYMSILNREFLEKDIPIIIHLNIHLLCIMIILLMMDREKNKQLTLKIIIKAI
jgi:hypothetical protein